MAAFPERCDGWFLSAYLIPPCRAAKPSSIIGKVEHRVEIYIAFFGRAPDSVGLAYWVGRVGEYANGAADGDAGLSIGQVANSFFEQPETQAKYPAGTTNEAFVDAVYQNAFHRAPDVVGRAYWISELDAGKTPRSQFIVYVLRGAYYDAAATPPTRDDSLITNLRIASEYYTTHAGDAAHFSVSDATWVLKPVTSDADTITISQSLTDQVISGFGVTPPVFASAVVSDSTLVMSYAVATMLDATHKAATTDFAVFVDGVADTVTAVADTVTAVAVNAVAQTVTLTLTTPVLNGQAVTVAYADPTASNDLNALQDAAGNDALSLTTRPVTNTTVAGTFTAGADAIVDTAGDDTFSATYDNGAVTDSFGGIDSINGSGGTDTLHIDHLIDVAITPPDTLWTHLKGIEKIAINTTGNGAQTITTGANFEAAFATGGVDLTTATSGSGAINVTMSTFTGAATITTTSIAGAQTVITGSGVTEVIATSGAGALDIFGAGLATATATTTGAGAQTIGDGGGGGANLVTVTAAANSGAQVITSTSTNDVTVHATATAAPQTITTGTGNDTVTTTGAAGQSNTITTHAGNDTIVASLGIDLITGGTGADRMTGGGGTDTFAFGADGSVIISRDVITDFNAAGADILTFGASTTVLAIDATALVAGSGAGSNVQQSAGGLITFHANDNTLALRIAAVQADVELDAANSVAMFIDGGNTYVYYAGTAAGNADDQLIELSGITSLSMITGGSTTMIA